PVEEPAFESAPKELKYNIDEQDYDAKQRQLQVLIAMELETENLLKLYERKRALELVDAKTNEINQ
ncbi:unnamed protein product, partial [Durusdinium trenchii]